jgi:FkbH-like protein
MPIEETGWLRYADALRLITAPSISPASALRLVSSSTTTELAALLRAYARVDGQDWSISGQDYGPLPQQLAQLPADGAATVVLVTVEDLLPELSYRGDHDWTDTRGLDDARAVTDRIAAGIELLADGMAQLRGPAVVVPPVVGPPALPVRSRATATRLATLPVAIGQRLAQAFDPVLDVDQALADLPQRRRSDDRLHLRAGSPFSVEAATRLAYAIDRILRPPSARKVLVTDLDGTLWPGVLADEGAEQVGSGQPDSRVHRLWQRLLLAARAQGVLLAVCSKNDPGSFLAFEDAALRERAGLLLAPDMFSAVSTSWQPKSTQLLELSERLGVGLDSFVLVDDNPVETAEVAHELPEVEVLRFPADGRGLAAFCADLQRAFIQPAGVLTAEDRSRADLYRLRHQAEQARAQAPSVSAFLSSLDMVLTMTPAASSAALRVQQLLNRTNQFTLTGNRYTDAEWAALRGTDDTSVYAGQLTDAYGDHGICVALVVDRAGPVPRLVEFAVSCRVFNRGVETAVLRWLVRHSGGTVLADWLPTGRNDKVRAALIAHGGAESPGGTESVRTIALPDAPPLWAGDCAVLIKEPSECA